MNPVILLITDNLYLNLLAITSTDLLDGPQYIILGFIVSASIFLAGADLFRSANKQASLAPVTVFPVPISNNNLACIISFRNSQYLDRTT